MHPKIEQAIADANVAMTEAEAEAKEAEGWIAMFQHEIKTATCAEERVRFTAQLTEWQTSLRQAKARMDKAARHVKETCIEMHAERLGA